MAFKGNAGGNTAGGITNGSAGSSGIKGKNIPNGLYVNTSGNGARYTFYTTTTVTVTLYTSKVSGDPYLEILNSSGTRLAYNDDGNGSLNARLTYTFNAYTSYTVVTRGFSNNSAVFYLYQA